MKVDWVGRNVGIIVRIKVGHDEQEQTHRGGWSQEEKSPLPPPPVEQNSAAGSKVEEHEYKGQGRRIRLIEGRLREYW